MDLKSLTKIESFVASLELAEVPSNTIQYNIILRDSSTVTKEAGYVDGRSIISFAAGIAGQAQADVLNSTLRHILSGRVNSLARLRKRSLNNE